MENTDIYNVTTHATLKYSIQNFQMSNVKYQISVFNTEIGFHPNNKQSSQTSQRVGPVSIGNTLHWNLSSTSSFSSIESLITARIAASL